MTGTARRWSAVEGDFDGGRKPGVFVIDADNVRRLATVTLLERQAAILVVGDHRGSRGVLTEAVRALPHVCVVGPRIAAGQPPQLIDELERVLPASPCVRAPQIVGTDRAVLSPGRLRRLEADLDAFVRSVLTAAGVATLHGATVSREDE